MFTKLFHCYFTFLWCLRMYFNNTLVYFRFFKNAKKDLRIKISTKMKKFIIVTWNIFFETAVYLQVKYQFLNLDRIQRILIKLTEQYFILSVGVDWRNAIARLNFKAFVAIVF